MGLLLATVGGVLFFWVFGSLAAALRPIDDEVRVVPVLRLSLGKVLRLAFRQYPLFLQSFFEDRQQARNRLIDAGLTQLKHLA